MPAEARLIAACGVDPNTVLAEPLRINGQRITFRRIVRLDGSPRINRAGTGLVTRPRTVWAPLDALTRYRGEVTR
jgi:hypothetical protein